MPAWARWLGDSPRTVFTTWLNRRSEDRFDPEGGIDSTAPDAIFGLEGLDDLLFAQRDSCGWRASELGAKKTPGRFLGSWRATFLGTISTEPPAPGG